MADFRFFERAGPFQLADLAQRIGAQLGNSAQAGIKINDVAAIDTAGEGDLTFLDNPRYAGKIRSSLASACVIAPRNAGKAPANMALLLSDDPYRAYALAAQAFYPKTMRGSAVYGDASGVASGAHVHESAQLATSVVVEPGAVVGAGVEIGDRTIIAANAVVAKNCAVGRDSYIGPGVSVMNALVGDRVMLHAGVRVGQDGFGFAMGLPHHEKVPQLGRVIIQDDVEIGANTTIDRGTGPDTIIGSGTKIDNLVQIGHNVQIGRGCIIVSQSGIAGSASLGDFVVLAARVGILGHLEIGSGVQLAGRSSVIHNIPAGEKWGGTPARPIRQWHRETIAIKRLAKKQKQ